ncbi:orotate phosphoribosyltransferase [Endomicrobium proavitum]|uniref:Orotate phosphoribosyltransferase n=1 Tax=Endomicrobium proavitum TaxID=1408281 RepID=A0A0G3WHQ6_9BACT|nr:orotate phosphoribosyltransferase [Endomicrobium proavitum]AKL98186.1 Orotate phosphoribosyltransferase [Endomicrobium proavitum]
MLTQQKKEFIAFMEKEGILTFGDFVTKSGRNTPYFVNTGNYRTGSQLAKLGKFYADAVHNVLKDNFSALFGPAYKGIPLAVTTAAALFNIHKTDKPYFFNRKEVKDHGEGGLTIGYKPKDNDRIIIIEDVITAGTAIREVFPLLKSIADVKVTDMFISVDRCEYGTTPDKTAVMQVKEEFNIEVHALVTAKDIRDYLAENSKNAEQVKKMDEYMAKYCILK